MRLVFADTETYSDLDLKKVGGYRYAEKCETMLFQWALEKGPCNYWDTTTGAPMPQELRDLLTDTGSIFVFHNAQFDRVTLALGQLKINLPINRIICTMALAYSHSLPGALGKLCELLQVPADMSKMKEGGKLINLFCKPRPKNMQLRRATRLTHPEEWQKFIEYGCLDVIAMREVFYRLPKYNMTNDEGHAYASDQQMNDRGFRIDVELCKKAMQVTAETQAALADEVLEETNGLIASATQRDKLLKYINAFYKINLPDLRVSTLEKLKDDESVHPDLRRLIKLRMLSSASSVSKFKKMIDAVCSDGRVRGAIQFRGAQRTGRDAGRMVQPQNFARPGKQYEKQVDQIIDLVKADHLRQFYGNESIPAVSACLRGAIIPAGGCDLNSADLSNIEGRGLAWLAGEEWKLDAFRAFDTITGVDAKGKELRAGPDLYIMAYAESFGVDPASVDDFGRQIGKIEELAWGYGGAIAPFVTFSLAYNIDLSEMVTKILPKLTEKEVRDSGDAYEWWLGKGLIPKDFDRKLFIVCDALKRKWRAKHPNICKFWRDLEEGWRVQCDGRAMPSTAGRIVIARHGDYMLHRLPSGRYLCYHSPGVDLDGQCYYYGVNQHTRQWGKIKSYGGKFAENDTQAFATDVFKYGVYRAEKAGFKPILLIHDDLVTESKNLPLDAQIKAMTDPIPWAPGLPLAAKGFQAARYRK